MDYVSPCDARPFVPSGTPANSGLSSRVLSRCGTLSSPCCNCLLVQHGCFFDRHTFPDADPRRISKRFLPAFLLLLSNRARKLSCRAFNTMESIFQMLTLVKHPARGMCFSYVVNVGPLPRCTQWRTCNYLFSPLNAMRRRGMLCRSRDVGSSLRDSGHSVKIKSV